MSFQISFYYEKMPLFLLNKFTRNISSVTWRHATFFWFPYDL